MATKPMSSWGPNIYIQLPLLAILGFLLWRAFTRKSEFYFDGENKTVSYFVQSLWAEDKGVVNISDVIEIVIQGGGAGDSGAPLQRLALVCRHKEIPMSPTYTNVIDFEYIKQEIESWLQKNTASS